MNRVDYYIEEPDPDDDRDAVAGCLIICIVAFLGSLILFSLSVIAGMGWRIGTQIVR
jgi:hypothetical protein